MFQQIVECVEDQGEMVDNIEVAVKNGMQTVDKSVDCIQKAKETKSKGRRKKAIICGGLTSVAIIIGAITIIVLV